MTPTPRSLAICTLLLFGLCTSARAEIKSGDNPEASPVWQKVRASLFQSRPIAAATDDVISLEVPVRAEDAAIVPIAIKTRFPQTAARFVDKVYLIIDNNPSPISAVFQFTPLSGQADIETRVRIDEYTQVRAIAETNDGQLHMTTRFLKASGGCSAPPGKDAQAALATLGRMKFRVEGDAKLHAAGTRYLRRPTRDVGRRRFFDQREPELPLLLPAARRRRTEGRGGRL
jgi:sulfur-oxidizing protein SoxY